MNLMRKLTMLKFKTFNVNLTFLPLKDPALAPHVFRSLFLHFKFDQALCVC